MGHSTAATHGQRVSITGMGLACSIGGTIDEFTEALRAGQCGVRSIDATDLPVSSAALIGDFEFESALHACEKLPAQLLDAAHLAGRRMLKSAQTAIYAALSAWQRANLHSYALDPHRVALVIGGTNLNTRYSYEHYQRFHSDIDFLPPSYGLHFLDTSLLGVVSEILRLQGPGFTVGGASASGNAAIVQGYHLIRSGLADVCVVIGAMAELSPLEVQGFKSMGAMGGKRFAGEKSSRPFDKDHEGFIYGQGCGCVILEAPVHARMRNATVLSDIAGAALLLDGNRLANPNAAGEARVMQMAIEMAKLKPSDVDYINAHGSSSPLGDETEVAAIRSLFGAHSNRIWLNSTKGLIGHCLWAAGVLETIATIIQMRGGFLHPNNNLENPIDNEIRFVGNCAEDVRVSCALTNSFGFGGINSSILLTSEFCEGI